MKWLAGRFRMPRVSLRRGFLYIVVGVALSLLVISIQQQGTWMPSTGNNIPVGVDKVFSNSREFLSEEGHDKGQHLPASRAALEAVSDTGGMAFPPVLSANVTTSAPEKRHWYLKDGLLRPTPPPLNSARRLKLWPDEEPSDRIISQLLYRPALPEVKIEDSVPLKKILIHNGMGLWSSKAGRGQFLKLKCPVDTCVLTSSRSELSTADAILFKDHFSLPPHKRNPKQVWIMYMLECPLHTQNFSHKKVFNWTATYRHDSDIVAPYEKWAYYDENVRQMPSEANFAANKTKLVAWFVSNCGAKNNRLQYAKELSKYIEVDIIGACGTKRCPRSNSAKCFEMLNRDYKFYLAFENSNCRDYITEKFFVNGLSHRILPIVMGAHPQDYRRAAPEKSYIHVDDFDSPKALADYLHLLDHHDELYNEYFRWKGTGEFINTYFFCRLCALLHDEGRVSSYQDINTWWRGPGTCISGSWRQWDISNGKKA